MNLLSTKQVAEKIGRSIDHFRKVIKHQPKFPKPFKAHKNAHPQWRESDIDNFINGGGLTT